MQDVFCTSAQFFQVVETDIGVWKRPIPGRVEKIDGTPQKGYYKRVLTYETLARKWSMCQIIPRDQLVQQWNDGDPNLMDMDFFLWGSQLDTDAPWTSEEDVDVSDGDWEPPTKRFRSDSFSSSESGSDDEASSI